MGLDIRLPIGLLFSIFGVLLIGYGVLGDESIYARSLDVNINLWWGIIMLTTMVMTKHVVHASMAVQKFCAISLG